MLFQATAAVRTLASKSAVDTIWVALSTSSAEIFIFTVVPDRVLFETKDTKAEFIVELFWILRLTKRNAPSLRLDETSPMVKFGVVALKVELRIETSSALAA